MSDSQLQPVELRCLRCDSRYPAAEMPTGCPRCLELEQPSSVVPVWEIGGDRTVSIRESWSAATPGVWPYPELLPVEIANRVTLHEGGTPLASMSQISDELGGINVLLKDERRNPSGSFKDRFFTVAISRARETGAEVVVIASSGNGGVAASAYAAAAGLRCVVITTPDISLTWRTAIETYGATLLATADSPSRWELMEAGIQELGWYPLTNYIAPPVGSNWYGVEGYKSIAYEIARELDWDVPAWVAVPVSRGDGLLGIWRGFQELRELGLIQSLPRMAAVERFPSLERALQDGLCVPPAIDAGPALARSIGDRAATYQSLHVIRESNGVAIPCDDDVLREYARKAGRGGFFLELSSAAGLVGAATLAECGLARPGDTVIALATASGMTDPSALAGHPAPLKPVAPTVQALRDLGFS